MMAMLKQARFGLKRRRFGCRVWGLKVEGVGFGVQGLELVLGK